MSLCYSCRSNRGKDDREGFGGHFKEGCCGKSGGWALYNGQVDSDLEDIRRTGRGIDWNILEHHAICIRSTITAERPDSSPIRDVMGL